MKIKNEKYIMPKTCIFANNIVGYIFVTNIVTDFTTSVYGSSCNYVSLFRPNLSFTYSFYCTYWHPRGRLGGQKIEWERKKREREKQIKRIAWTAVHRNGEIRVYETIASNHSNTLRTDGVRLIDCANNVHYGLTKNYMAGGPFS